MKKTPKKLLLNRETLRRLSIDKVKLAAGAGEPIGEPIGIKTLFDCPPPPLTTDSVRECCV